MFTLNGLIVSFFTSNSGKNLSKTEMTAITLPMQDQICLFLGRPMKDKCIHLKKSANFFFCQDDLENYFGRQHAIGSRRDNPTVRDFGYNDNIIKTQFSVGSIAGNVCGQSHKLQRNQQYTIIQKKETGALSQLLLSHLIKTAIFIATTL